jgi:hypothetical protein
MMSNTDNFQIQLKKDIEPILMTKQEQSKIKIAH